MLELRDIGFSYGRRPVLKGVSFDVAPGEVVALVGANGAGKTTLLDILATIALPSSGRFSADGRDPAVHPLAYRRLIGHLPERIALEEDMTVRDYLVYRAELKGEHARRIRRRVGEAVDLCGLSDDAGRVIRSLSAGRKKRVALADAVLLRPRVLLLDDLLAGFDGAFRASIGGILAAAGAYSCTVATGHEILDFARFVTRFVVLRDGTAAATVDAAGLDPVFVRTRVEAVLAGGDA